MSAKLYPLLFGHVYQDYLWGGSRLATLYRRADAPAVCAESWEISDRPEGMSVVRNGPHAGTTLASLVSRYGRALVGTAAQAEDRFPLLIKLIDARERLSVQVHPDDEAARLHGGEAKSEAWIMLDGQPDASVFCGWRAPMTEAAFRSLLAEGCVAQALRRIPAVPGTAVYMPGGRVHAIGEGCLILEVQQSSNTTYRVDDWGRVGSDGRPRAMHIEEAVKVIHWDDTGGQAIAPVPLPPLGGNTRRLLVISPYFHVERLELSREAALPHDDASFTALFVSRGGATCSSAGEELPLRAGDSCLVPAAVSQYTLRPAAGGAEVMLIRLRLPRGGISRGGAEGERCRGTPSDRIAAHRRHIGTGKISASCRKHEPLVEAHRDRKNIRIVPETRTPRCFTCIGGTNPLREATMRQPRVKPSEVDTFMHLYNRVAGHVGEFPFGPAEKELFVGLMRKLLRLYTLEVIAYQVMGNHFHLLTFIPGKGLPEEEAVARFNAYYDGKKSVRSGTERAAALPEQLRDVSRFMKDLQQQFTRWFNRTRPIRRRGHLWQERFKNTILEGGLSVWHCWQYLELNPVRAGIVSNPTDYRFCTLAEWSATGLHPWEQSVTARVLPTLPEAIGAKDMDSLLAALRRAIAIETATEAGASPQAVEAIALKAAEKQPFALRVDRRVRYWVDGLVIGSDIFVKNVMARARGEAAVAKRRLTRALAPDPAGSRPDLYSFRQLREIV